MVGIVASSRSGTQLSQGHPPCGGALHQHPTLHFPILLGYRNAGASICEFPRKLGLASIKPVENLVRFVRVEVNRPATDSGIFAVHDDVQELSGHTFQ